MNVSKYTLFVVALVLATCGSALPGLTSRESGRASLPLPPPVTQLPALLPDSSPAVLSAFAEEAPAEAPAPMPEELAFLRIPEGYVYWKTVTARVTAYEPSSRCCGTSADGRTALMDNAWQMDGVAVDPRAIPYRTLCYVPGVGLREADDTGVAMKKSWNREGVYHVDVRMKFFYQARNWGLQVLQVPLFRKRDSR